MMPEALYFRTYPSGKLCFIRERGQLAKKQRNLVPPLTCYNDLQTRIHFFFFLFHSTFPLQEGTLFLSSVVSIPHLRAPPFSSTEGSSIMPENQRWHTTPPSLKQTNPTVFTRSVFARYFLFSPTLQLGAKRVWVRWTRWISNDPTLYSPFGRRNSHGKLCLPRTIFQSQIDFKVSVYTIARLRRTARSLSRPVYSQIESNSPRLSLPEWTRSTKNPVHDIFVQSSFRWVGVQSLLFSAVTRWFVITRPSGNVINVRYQHFFQYLCLHLKWRAEGQ